MAKEYMGMKFASLMQLTYDQKEISAIESTFQVLFCVSVTHEQIFCYYIVLYYKIIIILSLLFIDCNFIGNNILNSTSIAI
jgi:hypothetical protein